MQRPLSTLTVRSLFHSLPHTLGEYVLTKLLGHGTYGCVYKAHCCINKTEVAIKVIDLYPHVTRTCVDGTVWLELHAHHIRSSLHDPDCKLLRDYRLQRTVRYSKFLCLVLSYVPGISLRQAIEQSSAVGEPIRVGWLLRRIYEIASALLPLHDLRLMHNDVRSVNVMLTGPVNDVNTRAVLIDFGFVTASMCNARTAIRIQPAINCAAPETQDWSDIGPPSDCWLLGVLLATWIAQNPHSVFHGQNTIVSFMNDGEPSAHLWHVQQKIQCSPTFGDATRMERHRVENILTRLLHPVPEQRPSCKQLLTNTSLLYPYRTWTQCCDRYNRAQSIDSLDYMVLPAWSDAHRFDVISRLAYLCVQQEILWHVWARTVVLYDWCLGNTDHVLPRTRHWLLILSIVCLQCIYQIWDAHHVLDLSIDVVMEILNYECTVDDINGIEMHVLDLLSVYGLPPVDTQVIPNICTNTEAMQMSEHVCRLPLVQSQTLVRKHPEECSIDVWSALSGHVLHKNA